MDSSTTTVSAAGLVFGALLLAFVVVCLCLIPKPENDLFFELRIGTDILSTGHLPHVDTYSWTNRGTRWDVPEWLSFVIYALAYRQGAFFGVWLTMVAVMVACVWTVWFFLAPRLGFAWAFQLTNLMALALSDYIQERPYVYTYLFLALTLSILVRSRAPGARALDRPAVPGSPLIIAQSTTPVRSPQNWGLGGRLLLLLPPLCAVWTNLHQGVLVLVCLLIAYALGDAIQAVRGHTEFRRSAIRMLSTAVACALASMASPYGWRVYWNVWITLRDHTMMSNVTEWNSIAVLPFAQMQAFVLIAAIVVAAIASSRRATLADALALSAMFVESLLHARNTALFAIAAIVIGAPYFESGVERLRRVFGSADGIAVKAALGFVGVLYLTAVTAVGMASLKPAIGPKGWSLEGIGEAAARVPSYPDAACTFVLREGFPPNLRLFNNFSIGGYLMWRLPSEPDFVDGRLDVFTGSTFDDMLTIARHPGSTAADAVIRRYNLDCVITTTRRIADAFAARPDWVVVYADPPRPHHSRCVILLRRRPRFAALIARCTARRV